MIPLEGARVRIESTVGVPVEIDLARVVGGEPSLAMRVLKPKVIITHPAFAMPVATAAPYGEPTEGPPWALLMVVGVVVGLVLVIRA